MAAQPYFHGPIFDVQAHAILPSSFPSVYQTLQPPGAPLNDTTAHNNLEICQNLADDLVGSARNQTLGRDNKQVVTVNAFFPDMSIDQLLGFVNETNVWMAGATADRSNLLGTATIPPPPRLAKAGLAPDGEAYSAKGVRLVRRAVQASRFRAIMVSSNYDDVYPGDASYDPYFALAHELAIPVILHPAVAPVGAGAMAQQNVAVSVGYLNDQRAALLSMIMAGTLDRYPDLAIIATHLGGGILTGIGRFQQLQGRFPRYNEYVDPRDNTSHSLRQPVEYYLKQLHYDCNNAELSDVHHAISVVGADRLLTGTDFPWTDDVFTRQVLGELDASSAQKIAYANAANIFG